MIFYRLMYLLTTPVLMSSLKYINRPLIRMIPGMKRPIHIVKLSVDQKISSRQSMRIHSHKSEIPKSKNLAPKYIPKTPNQQIYQTHLKNPDTSIVLGIGPAGCGKTLFACLTALDQLKNQKIDKIILTRPIVPVEDEEIGFLPGTLLSKMDPWTRPIFDIILEQYPQHELTMMLKNNIIEVSPLAFMRGRTFKNAFIIADEMQNSSPNQMLMLTTRLGTNSKLVITGDLKQSDRTYDNGLRDLMYKLRLPQNQNLTDIKMVEMQYEDVERSKIVKTMLEIYSREPTVPSIARRAIQVENPRSAEGSLTLRPLPLTSSLQSNDKIQIDYKNNCESCKNKKVDNDAALIPKNQMPSSDLL